jgi:hypothetical protein
MSGADIPALRFNGAATNYTSRHAYMAAGGVTITDVPTVSATMMRLSGVSANGSRIYEALITNNGSWEKPAIIHSAQAPGNAAAVEALEFPGAGKWVNSAGQITSITLLTAGGATMNDNSGILIFGRNLG